MKEEFDFSEYENRTDVLQFRDSAMGYISSDTQNKAFSLRWGHEKDYTLYVESIDRNSLIQEIEVFKHSTYNYILLNSNIPHYYILLSVNVKEGELQLELVAERPNELDFEIVMSNPKDE